MLQRLDEPQLKELVEDIQSYHTLESNPRNREYWTALLALCADRRQKLKPQAHEGRRAVSSVAADVDRILGPKTLAQLEALETQIRAKLRSDEPIDTDYWEELLRSLLVYKARAKLKELCAAIKEARVGLLRARDPEKARALEESDGFADPEPAAPVKPAAPRSAAPSSTAVVKAQAASSSSAPPPGTARFAPSGNEDFSQATKALYDREVARGVGEGEEIFAAEEAVPGIQKPLWADKYRPRKPRYFNRVLMGYEWNKYNQTHYDHDNPPPKVVQGYRFNIFYPDLIDKTKAPTYKIIREHGRRKGESFAPAGKEDTCLIRFIAGPPYEDIAFRIVDREWDYSAKKERGFKSTFDKVSQWARHGHHTGVASSEARPGPPARRLLLPRVIDPVPLCLAPPVAPPVPPQHHLLVKVMVLTPSPQGILQLHFQFKKVSLVLFSGLSSTSVAVCFV